MSFSSSNQVQISKNTLVSIFNTIEPSISFSTTYNENDIVGYYIIKYKYLDKRDEEFICEHMNLTKEDFKFEDIRLKCSLYIKAKNIGLIKEVD